jgi:hypothetical protein
MEKFIFVAIVVLCVYSLYQYKRRSSGTTPSPATLGKGWDKILGSVITLGFIAGVVFLTYFAVKSVWNELSRTESIDMRYVGKNGDGQIQFVPAGKTLKIIYAPIMENYMEFDSLPNDTRTILVKSYLKDGTLVGSEIMHLKNRGLAKFPRADYIIVQPDKDATLYLERR